MCECDDDGDGDGDYGNAGCGVDDRGEELVELVGDGLGGADEVHLVGGLLEDELEDLVGLDGVLVLDEELGLDAGALLLLVLELLGDEAAGVGVGVLLLLLLEAHADLRHLERCLQLC